MVNEFDKQRLERIKSYSVRRQKEKEIALCKLERGIRDLVSEFTRTHEVQILDAWIDDPETIQIHLDTEFSGPGYDEKSTAINELESEIQRLAGEFSEGFGVKIIDVRISDSNPDHIHFETNL